MVQIGISSISSINHEENLHPRIQLTDPFLGMGSLPTLRFEKPTDRQDPDPENPTEGHPLVVPWAAFRFVSRSLESLNWWDFLYAKSKDFSEICGMSNLWNIPEKKLSHD